MIRFSDGEPNGLGFIREGAGHGPLRLLVSDTAIYLLARLDHRLLTFNLQGRLLDSVDLEFCPADFTYDARQQFHFLQYRAHPAFISTHLGGVELLHREFEIPVNREMKEIGISPSGEVLLLSGGYTYRIVAAGDTNQLLALGERSGRFHLTDTHIERVEGSFEVKFTGTTAQGPVASINIVALGWELFQFHTDDRAGRIYIVGTSLQKDEEGETYIARRLLVAKNGTLLADLRGFEAGHSSYDFANHDIAVAPNGDVYLWRTHFDAGFSEILMWKAAP